MKRLLILLVLAGCGGTSVNVADQPTAADTKSKNRQDYIATRRAAGASMKEIVAEIRLIDAGWYRELVKRGLAKP